MPHPTHFPSQLRAWAVYSFAAGMKNAVDRAVMRIPKERATEGRSKRALRYDLVVIELNKRVELTEIFKTVR